MIAKNPLVDEYIATFPEEAQEQLQLLRKTITDAVPEAEEIISYKMPCYHYKGNLVYFAAYKNHIGFYPGASGIASFQKEISRFKNSKGAVQFPINEKLPLDLVRKITIFRWKENKLKNK